MDRGAKPLLATPWRSLPRSEELEHLELGLGEDAGVALNLIEMHRIEQRLGGLRALDRHLKPRLMGLETRQPVTILDLGTGSAGMPRHLLKWARTRGIQLTVIGLDSSRRNLNWASRWSAEHPALNFVQADALQLPFAQGRPDFIISTLFLHHLTPAQVTSLLWQAYMSSREGIVMADLVRGWIPYFAFKCIQPFFARHPLTRHDGALSVRRAYTPGELLQLSRAAGLPQAQVYTSFPWRMTLVVDRPTVRED